MGLLSQLLTDLLTSLTLGRLSVSKKRLSYILIGLLGVMLGVASLLAYYFISPPMSKDQYYVTSIEYSRCYATESKKSVVLENNNTKYFLDDYMWNKNYTYNEIVDLLNQSSKVTVWIPSKESKTIKGIAAPNFKIEPSVGEAWDRSNRRAWLWAAVLFLSLGILLIISACFVDESVEESEH
jgi:hypothetical protein